MVFNRYHGTAIVAFFVLLFAAVRCSEDEGVKAGLLRFLQDPNPDLHVGQNSGVSQDPKKRATETDVFPLAQSKSLCTSGPK